MPILAIWPWYGNLVRGQSYPSAEVFLDFGIYKNVKRWTDDIAERLVVRRGRMIKKASGDSSEQLHERYDVSDLKTKRQDKIGKALRRLYHGKPARYD